MKQGYLINFTLPAAGTYLITYSTRGEIQTLGSGGFLVSFLTDVVGTVIPNTEILVVTSTDASRFIAGGTGTGSYVVTVNAPTAYWLAIRSNTLPGIVFNNGDGRTSVTYTKLTP